MEDIAALNPDVVIIATGGMPNTELFENGKGAAHVVTSWETIAGDVKPAQNVLIYDEAGTFQLFRIGDAVSARNTHAAIYDALRLVKDL